MQAESNLRIGQGFDVHTFAEGRKLILGGVEIKHARGLLGHSDADVLTHAIIDALVGAAGLGDIGHHFPDTEAKWKDADSIELLRAVVRLLDERHMAIVNLDATILAQKPRLAEHLPAMREILCEAMGLTRSRVNLKAGTTEQMGFVGREEGIAALAVVLLSTGPVIR